VWANEHRALVDGASRRVACCLAPFGPEAARRRFYVRHPARLLNMPNTIRLNVKGLKTPPRDVSTCRELLPDISVPTGC
jgi:hypothetical protein